MKRANNSTSAARTSAGGASSRAGSGEGSTRSTTKGAGAKRPASERSTAKRRGTPGGSDRRPRRDGRREPRATTDPSRVFLQRLVGLMPDAVVTLGLDGGLRQWSAGAARLTGRRRREVGRRGFRSLFQNPEDFDRFWEDLASRERVTGYETELAHADGRSIPIRIQAARLPRDASLPRRSRRHQKKAGARRRSEPSDAWLLILHDRTELHQIRSRLIETEKLSAMAKIAGSVAHEFRNPLNSLFLSTDLLEDELEGHTAIREAISPTLAAIREEIERLNQIIHHYLSLSKIAGSTPEVMDLGEAAKEFAAGWEDRAKERGVVLRVRADEGPHPFTADPDQVRRVLVNLVENAFDALAEAEAEEEGSRARSGTITLVVRRMRRSVKLVVKDNGPGIAPELRERVFEPFFTSKSGGSGLGLYLVREIALAADGSMSLSSGEGRGTSVSVRWPLAESEGN